MLKAIETVYDGYRFRSRLEARWAVFFKTLGIKYEYEKEGYNLDGVYYLPDFWLPEQKCWVEIKGQEPTREEHEKCFKLMKHANPKSKQNTENIASYEKRVFLFAGDIPLPDEQGSKSCWSAYGYHCAESSYLLAFCGWVECPFCCKVDITAGGTIDDLSCRCVKKYIRIEAIEDILGDTFCRANPELNVKYMDKVYMRKRHAFLFWGDTPRLVAAYTAARQARFEHGERG